jgi:DNA invertase Pin-like site-specific DNA recombinase
MDPGLEGEPRTGRRNRKPAAKSARTVTRRVKPAGARTRAPRGQNKATVLDALKNGPMTASEIAKATGISTGTVSTMLTKMAKSGELAKAERGYRLPQ